MSVESYISTLALPGNAPSLNGTYLEDIIDGYRTSDVSGRDSLDSEINEITIDTQDGSRYKNKRYTPKEITVKYYITCDSPENVHNSARELRGFLDQNRSLIRVIFNDDPDVYYEAIVSSITMEKIVNNSSLSGSYVLRCLTPYAYSVEEFVVESEEVDGHVVLTADYGGTSPAQPILEATLPGPTGYVGFINDSGKLIQVGDPDEEDRTSAASKTKQVLNKSFKNNNTTGFTLNSRGAADTTAEGDTKASREGLTVNSLGSNSSIWHGPSLVADIPTDPGEEIVDCAAYITYIVGILQGNIKCNGGVTLALVGYYPVAPGEAKTYFNVATISVWKRSASSDQGAAAIWINNKQVWFKTFKMGTLNTTYGGVVIHSE